MTTIRCPRCGGRLYDAFVPTREMSEADTRGVELGCLSCGERLYGIRTADPTRPVEVHPARRAHPGERAPLFGGSLR